MVEVCEGAPTHIYCHFVVVFLLQVASKGGELKSRDQIVKNRKKQADLRSKLVPQKRKKGQSRKLGGSGSKAYSKGGSGGGKKSKR